MSTTNGRKERELRLKEEREKKAEEIRLILSETLGVDLVEALENLLGVHISDINPNRVLAFKQFSTTISDAIKLSHGPSAITALCIALETLSRAEDNELLDSWSTVYG